MVVVLGRIAGKLPAIRPKNITEYFTRNNNIIWNNSNHKFS